MVALIRSSLPWVLHTWMSGTISTWLSIETTPSRFPECNATMFIVMRRCTINKASIFWLRGSACVHTLVWPLPHRPDHLGWTCQETPTDIALRLIEARKPSHHFKVHAPSDGLSYQSDRCGCYPSHSMCNPRDSCYPCDSQWHYYPGKSCSLHNSNGSYSFIYLVVVQAWVVLVVVITCVIPNTVINIVIPAIVVALLSQRQSEFVLSQWQLWFFAFAKTAAADVSTKLSNFRKKFLSGGNRLLTINCEAEARFQGKTNMHRNLFHKGNQTQQYTDPTSD